MQRTANIGLAKAGLTEVIEHLYFYQHLCLTSADDFQIPRLRQALSRSMLFFCQRHTAYHWWADIAAIHQPIGLWSIRILA